MSMKLLFVSGSDFVATSFEEKYKGQLVSDFLHTLDLENGEEINTGDPDYPAEAQYEVVEFDIEPKEGVLKLLQKIRDESDSDMLKHSNYYAENQVIGQRY